MTDLMVMLTQWIQGAGINEVKDSTKKHFRRKLEAEFGNSLHILQDDKGKLMVYPDNLSRNELVKQVIILTDKVELLQRNNSDLDTMLNKTMS